MRLRPTPAESQATLLLQTTSLRFLSQVPFGWYILDFVIPSLLLVIEVDGSSHDSKAEYDRRRDEFIVSHGLSVIHIKNEHVVLHLPSLVSSMPKIPFSTPLWKEILKKANSVHKKKQARLKKKP